MSELYIYQNVRCNGKKKLNDDVIDITLLASCFLQQGLKKKTSPKFSAMLDTMPVTTDTYSEEFISSSHKHIYIHISDFCHFPYQKKKLQLITVFVQDEFKM